MTIDLEGCIFTPDPLLHGSVKLSKLSLEQDIGFSGTLVTHIAWGSPDVIDTTLDI